jgi:hypothetical protein
MGARMMRTAASLSLFMMLSIAGASACSSKAVDGDDEKGGTGSIISAGTTSGGSGGGGAGSGGSGGTTSAGTTSNAGSGGSADLCAGKPNVCVDAATVQACNPETGMNLTGNCAEEFAKDGLISNGCTDDADGIGCTLDDFADQPCVDGTGPFAFCGGLTEDQLIDVYVSCFHDVEGLHTIVPCFADYVDDTAMPPTVDCAAAEAACFPAEMP